MTERDRITIWDCESPLIPHDHAEKGCKGTTYVREDRIVEETPGEELSEPWGHKVTIHVYVEGDINRADAVSDFYASLAPEPEPDFVGIGISEVAKRPVDQGAG